jgi:hypothetical protein
MLRTILLPGLLVMSLAAQVALTRRRRRPPRLRPAPTAAPAANLVDPALSQALRTWGRTCSRSNASTWPPW